MSATFDPTLATDRDYVRLLIGDTVVATAQLQDETIDALIAKSPTLGVFCIAAEAAELIIARWDAKAEGVIEKQVSKLRLRRSETGGMLEDYRKHVDRLRERCAELSFVNRPAIFKIV